MMTVLVMLVLIFMTMSEKQMAMKYRMGEIQGAAISTQSRAEKAMFFIDRSAVYSEVSAGYKLAKGGGFYDASGCSDYFGITMWNSKGRECWPEGAAEAYERYFIDDLKQRLTSYPDTSLLDIRYTVFQKDGNLYGYAIDSIVMPVLYIQPKIVYDNLETRRIEEIRAVNPPAPSTGARYIWPGNSTVVTSCYGWRNIDYGSTEHRGIDIRAAVGDPVYAIADGKAKIGKDVYNTLTIEHSEGVSSVYIHNSAVLVKSGDSVRQGDVIALAGKAGAKYPHIHFTLKRSNAYADPLDPDKGIYSAMPWKVTRSSNCYYACSQYSYCNVIQGRVE
jgi:hypothetical protein